MTNTREKLIELLDDFMQPGKANTLGEFADHLVAHGVTILSAQESISKLEEENKRLLRQVNGVTLEEWLGGEDNQKVLSEPLTNADRIRQMSDEELATQLVQIFREGIKVLTDVDMPAELLDKCWNSFFERLKQPAEE